MLELRLPNRKKLGVQSKILLGNPDCAWAEDGQAIPDSVYFWAITILRSNRVSWHSLSSPSVIIFEESHHLFQPRSCFAFCHGFRCISQSFCLDFKNRPPAHLQSWKRQWRQPATRILKKLSTRCHGKDSSTRSELTAFKDESLDGSQAEDRISFCPGTGAGWPTRHSSEVDIRQNSFSLE